MFFPFRRAHKAHAAHARALGPRIRVIHHVPFAARLAGIKPIVNFPSQFIQLVAVFLFALSTRALYVIEAQTVCDARINHGYTSKSYATIRLN
jgi:hypothetical protein